MLTARGIFRNACITVRISAYCAEYSGVSITGINAPVYPAFPRLVPSVKMRGTDGTGW